MKHFWVFTFVSIIITAFFGGFAFPEEGYAAITQSDVDSVINKVTTEFSAIPNVDINSNIQKDVLLILRMDAKAEFKNKGSDTNITPTAFEYAVLKLYAGDLDIYQKGLNPTLAPSVYTTLSADKNVVALLSAKAGAALSVEQGVATPVEADKFNAEATARSAASAATIQNALVGKCNFLATSSFIYCINDGLAWFIKSILLNIVGFFLWMSANLLNFAMYHGVFKFSEFAPKEIYNIWLVVRQIISLFVFFAGLFVGFMAIIGKSEEFKKYVVFLVVFGLFVNFSYPIVRVFVDISNVVSLQVYQTTLGDNILLTDNPSGDGTAGARIMSSMGLQGLVMSATSLPDKANAGGSGFIDQVTSLPGAIAIVGIVGSAAYILFMIAMMLIARTALLVCIIVASPILLVDTIVPALGEKAKWLRGVFISQLFVAPVFAIMLALTLKFLDIFSGLNKGPSALTGAGANTTAVFFNLIMMLVMLWVMYKVTKTVAGSVGDTVTSWAGKAGGMGTGMALGAGAATLGFAGRNTVGRLASNLGKKDWGGGVLGNAAKSTFSKIGDASFDGRKFGIVQSVASTAGITNLGKGGQNGYTKNREEYEEKTFKRAGEIGNDEARAEYLGRRLPTGNLAKWTGRANENSKAYNKFVKGDEDTMKQYVNADEEGRKKMVADEKNKKYLDRFSDVDKAPTDNKAIGKMSTETKTAYEAKVARDSAKEERNKERVANYLTADQSTRENLYANARQADDKKLLAQLDILDKLRGEHQPGTISKEMAITAGLDEVIAEKVEANDQLRKINIDAQNTQRASQEAVNTARIASNKTAEETRNLMRELVNGNNDLANQIRMLAGGTPLPKTGASTPSSSPLIIPTSGGAGRSKQPVPVQAPVPQKEMREVKDTAQALPA